ncbi:NAD(P)H-dependent oxidoreductase subunit E [Chthonobacter albigriseus]|uniref:NAD(P)H-dependent oxidoreductase subunit E n=1 Tax=Chthonobacter albigriseus TaxID=1683161 RepID=UPI0015EF18B8|nr:NAD(P)H-dependent oxidoreductase subunit E [Chthonobacter albigriseus]
MTVKFAEKSRPVRRDAAAPKGRQVDDVSIAEVNALLGGASLARDLLIEHLHKLQDHYGCLHARHLRALAEVMRLAQAEVFEVASFYHHFDIVKEGQAAPAPVTIRVCDSLSCMLAGAESLITALQAGADPNQVRIVRAACIGRCAEAPAAIVGRNAVGPVTAEELLQLAATQAVKPVIPDYTGLEAYRAAGGYTLLESCLKGERTAEEIIALLSDSGLRGLGGAGFPTGRKWSIVKGFAGPRLMTINGDEGEPGTFKDRYHLERDPHRMIEGALIAAWAVGCERIYMYMRDEYPTVLEILAREFAAVTAAGLADHAPLVLRRGAGAYICGEESAMIESIEGKRGLPRHRPPYIAEVGLFDRPTLNHNVETLFWVRDIVEKGVSWFADQGARGSKGFRSWSVSGRVKDPGVKLAPAGVSVRELIEQYCGGMLDGHTFKAYLPGGASGGILPAALGDIPLDFGGQLASHGAFVGSHAVVILSDQDSIKDVAINLISFFQHESCGQCTPCRAGTEKLTQLLKLPHINEGAMNDVMQVMRDASICGLGQAAPNPVNHLLTFFHEDLTKVSP